MSRLSLLDHFSALDDPRQRGKVVYPLPEIMLLVLRDAGRGGGFCGNPPVGATEAGHSRAAFSISRQAFPRMTR